MNARAMATAQERQFDWLLGEVLGEVLRNGVAKRSPAAGLSRWLAAALALLAIGVAVGVAVLRDDASGQAAQEPARDVEWTECHGPAALAAVDKDVTALKCFDFDDAACAQLARFTSLECLDLSGKDVNEKGWAVALKITDTGVRALGALTKLRWLSLATCHEVKGEGLQALEALPRLEHLDLTYTGVESPAIERLPRLPSLRSLVLSRGLYFHGRSLAAVATIPGLRRLELQACTTLAAKDVLHLVKLKELRHLDLRDCQGRYRGQRLSAGEIPGAEEPPEPPVEDSIGITDDVVIALSALPLETLLLGGSESLTDAIGDSLAKMTTLRRLDISNLPKVTGAVLTSIPGELEALALDHNPQFDAIALLRLPPLAALRELGLGRVGIDGATLKALLANKRLVSLRLGGAAPSPRKDRRNGSPGLLRSADLAALSAQKELRSLDLSFAGLSNREALAIVATLPRLTELDLSGESFVAEEIAPLAASHSLRSLVLANTRLEGRDVLGALAGVPLRELDLVSSNARPSYVQEVAKAWTGCIVTMPDARRWRVP